MLRSQAHSSRTSSTAGGLSHHEAASARHTRAERLRARPRLHGDVGLVRRPGRRRVAPYPRPCRRARRHAAGHRGRLRAGRQRGVPRPLAAPPYRLAAGRAGALHQVRAAARRRHRAGERGGHLRLLGARGVPRLAAPPRHGPHRPLLHAPPRPGRSHRGDGRCDGRSRRRRCRTPPRPQRGEPADAAPGACHAPHQRRTAGVLPLHPRRRGGRDAGDLPGARHRRRGVRAARARDADGRARLPRRPHRRGRPAPVAAVRRGEHRPQSAARPGRADHHGLPRLHPGAGRPRLAARPGRGHRADPRYEAPWLPGGERGGGRHRTRC